MFIYWGKKQVVKKLGYVADFCPICRDAARFQLRRIGIASHLYGIALGEGELLGHNACCQLCRNEKTVDASCYSRTSNVKTADLESLIITTFPNLREVYASRLVHEENIRRGEPLAPSDREVFLIEPFYFLAGQTEALFAGSLKIDKLGGLGCLGTLILFVSVMGIGSAIWDSENSHDIVISVACMLGIMGFVTSVTLMAMAPNRQFAQQIIPSLVRALKPLQPTKSELADCLERMKAGGYKLGKKGKLELLWAALQQEALHR